MSKKKKVRKRKISLVDKYEYGSYVIQNQPIPEINKANVGSTAISTAASGASLGFSVGGPTGALIGGGLGLIGGIFSGNKRRKSEKNLQRKLVQDSLDNYGEQYDNMVGETENPLGVYKKGGDIHIKPENRGKFTKSAKAAGMGVQEFASHVLANKDKYSSTQVKRANFARNASKWKHQEGGDVGLDKINIELGELQVDPESGKILREFKGFNPETGGKYEPHNSKGKDTINNHVTAEEGTFIITKEKSKEYKKALDNNDKLAQNTIMHNIRKNKRKSLLKYQEGGPVLNAPDPLNMGVGILPSVGTLNALQGADLAQYRGTIDNNPYFRAPSDLIANNTMNSTTSNNNFNYGNLLGLLPSAVNLLQGMGTPNYIPQSNTPANRYAGRIESNMPRDINYSPLLNRMYRDRNTAYRQIGDTTSSSAIARANRQNLFANTQRGIQDMYFQGEGINNSIRAQRAGMYSQLGQDDYQRFAGDRAHNYNVGLTNRQMDMGRRGQFLTGISQLGQYQSQLDMNNQIRNREQQMLELFGAMNPYSDRFLSRFRTGGSNA